MAAVLLDTTVLIDALRGRAAAGRLADLHDRGYELYTCAVNVEEIYRGVLPREADAARRLFAGLRLIPLERVEGERAGTWRREFARRGRTLAQADCLIASAAVTAGARLATGNPKDFPMREVDVDHWPTGA